MIGDFRKRLRSGEKLYGTMVTLTTPSVAEIFADLGFDWLFVDAEHGPFETAELLAVLQAVGHRIPCIVRVPSANEVAIKKTLDLGAAGIIAPQINSAEQAADVVKFARYAPEGNRGVGLSRAHGYGYTFSEYLATANERVTVVVQAEHRDAVENIESIVQVPGIDCMLIGPYDLSASYGKMGQIHDPEITGAIDHVAAVCKSAGIPMGIFGVTVDAIRPYIEKGYTFLVGATDTVFLMDAGKKMLDAMSEV
ncbi:MAG: 2,4-dihydroxyhept-2-ene-1,7-dioic acid aldolase [Planctomycetales bacterium]|nr:2,4-dihydroxyhept-2-ene-1,7-dioic acid aldolase [Planctomycetales bacterium]